MTVRAAGVVACIVLLVIGFAVGMVTARSLDTPTPPTVPVPAGGAVPPGAPFTAKCEGAVKILTTPQGGITWVPAGIGECP